MFKPKLCIITHTDQITKVDYKGEEGGGGGGFQKGLRSAYDNHVSVQCQVLVFKNQNNLFSFCLSLNSRVSLLFRGKCPIHHSATKHNF